MQLSSDRFTEIAKDGIITLIVGLALSLLTLVPNEMISQFNKLRLAIIIIVVSLLLLGLKIFYEDLSEYREARYQVNSYMGKLPNTVHFDFYNRDVQIHDNGDATITDRLKIENVSDEFISAVSIPSECDIYEDVNPEQLSDESKYQVTEMEIGDNDISTPSNCCERDGVLFGGRVPEEKVKVRIPFETIDQKLSPRGQSGSVKEVQVKYTVDGALEKAIVGEKDFLAIMPIIQQKRLKSRSILPTNIILNQSE